MNSVPMSVFSAELFRKDDLYNSQYISLEVEDWVGQLEKDIAVKLLEAFTDGRFDDELDILRKTYKVRVYTKTCTEEMPLHLKFASVVLSGDKMGSLVDEKEIMASAPVSMRTRQITIKVKTKLFSRVWVVRRSGTWKKRCQAAFLYRGDRYGI